MNEVEAKELFCRPTDERALLAFCLRSMDNYYDLVHKVTDRDFLYSDNRNLFNLLGSLAQYDVQAFDVPMVINFARQSFDSLDPIGGMEYLQSITDMTVSKKNFSLYLQNVLESSTKYKLYNILKENMAEIASNAKDGKAGSDLIGSVEHNILDLSTASRAIKEPRNMSDGLRELIDERLNTPVKLMGLETGFPILDRQIDGLVPGTLNIISARPKKGKSTFLSNIAVHAAYMADNQVPVLYVDTEMSFDEWRDRNIAAMSGVKERDVKHGGYDMETHGKIMRKCVDAVENGILFHEYMPGYTVDKLVSIYKKYKLKHDIGLMIFDYIKEPDAASLDRRRKEYQILGDVTTKLKDLAGELNIPCLTAVQINRNNSVADSDRIVRYADTIMQWMEKSEEEITGNPSGWKGGGYKLVVRETRRGGMTAEEGIGYIFKKEILSIEEALPPDQLVKYGERVVNYGDHEQEEQRVGEI